MCYGVETCSSTWICSFCEVNGAEQVKHCELCPNTTGALKPTTSGKWIHMVCALYTPSVVINDPTTMQPVNIDKVPKKSYGLRCYICESMNIFNIAGACVNCNAPKCKRNLHVKCGQLAGTLREKTSRRGNLMFTAYCEDHIDSKAPRISLNSISTVLVNRKKGNDRAKAKAQNSQWLINHLPVSDLIKFHEIPILPKSIPKRKYSYNLYLIN